MDPGRPTQMRQSVPTAAAEIEITTGTSSAPSTTESQLVAMLSESRREAESLRQELVAVRKKADADHRRLQALSIKSPDHQIRIFQERLARAEAALEEAETRSRFVERNWLQVERYLTAMQNQAADSRAAFSRLMDDIDGRLVLPSESPPARRRDIPLREFISSSGPGHRSTSNSHLHHDSSSASSHSPRSQDYIRPLPLVTPRRRPSSPLRSPSGIEDERWHVDEQSDRSPPYKRRRGSGLGGEPGMGFRQRLLTPSSSSRTPPPLPRIHNADRERHPSREHMPPPPALPSTDSHRPYRPSETLRTYDARNPPLQFIQHRHPPAPPRPPTPPSPPRARNAADPQHQYQHRFHLSTGSHGPRRPVRPGAYETVVFALDSDTSTQGIGGDQEGQPQGR
ncbi:hypothetical protein B0H13DRAFT_2555750 [Mycena leptocephala]|nr:hypothetical protein B0H13DRAFT_2555750 [Mycena leptocephala]